MRIHVIAIAPGDFALAEVLSARGHQVTLFSGEGEAPAGVRHRRVPGRLPAKTKTAALSALVGGEIARARPEVVYLPAQAALLPLVPALRTLRIPYVFGYGAPLLGDKGLLQEALKPALRQAALGATVVVASTSEAEAELTSLGLAGAARLLPPVALDLLPLGAREEAKEALGLVPQGRFLALVGPWDADVRFDLLALAHRRLAGVGLLLVGEGAQAHLVGAMAAATRPSSPVITLGDETPARALVAACAADICLSLTDQRCSPAAWRYAALGRRQVAFRVPGCENLDTLYPGHEAVFYAERSASDLEATLAHALKIEATEGPLPAGLVQQARERLSNPAAQLAHLLESCG